MNIWLAKRRNKASRWCNFEFIDFNGVFDFYIAYRTRKDAQAFCDEQKSTHGTDWVVVKFTEVKSEK